MIKCLGSLSDVWCMFLGGGWGLKSSGSENMRLCSGGLVQMFIWCLGPFSVWSFSVPPSPIYREGVWMVLGGVCGGLNKVGM